MCQSFTAPTGEICPGDDVTFTCVVETITQWTVDPGDDGECIYLSAFQNTDTCGPDGRFTSSRTEMSDDINNSSLSVVNITIDLAGTLVECTDATGNFNESSRICIIGESFGISVSKPHNHDVTGNCVWVCVPVCVRPHAMYSVICSLHFSAKRYILMPVQQ